MRPRCAVDDAVERKRADGFAFPLGVYPVEEMTPLPGYRVEFEPADTGGVPGGGPNGGLPGGGPGEGDEFPEFADEWPDRYVFDVVISADRIESLFYQLIPLIPGRVYPILDFIGHDAYREIDPYIARNLVGTDWLLDAVRACKPFFFEDGMCGFGALSDDPFMHLVIDEHKILTIRCEPEMKERFERVLHAFDLQPIEEPSGADAAAHEHRNVLWTPDERPDLLSAEEIVEDLRDAWQLELNVDITRNTDDGGRELGITAWRCVVRCEDEEMTRYAEVLATADCLLHAEELAYDATLGLIASEGGPEEATEPTVVSADRMTPAQLTESLADGSGSGDSQAGIAATTVNPTESRVLRGRWLV